MKLNEKIKSKNSFKNDLILISLNQYLFVVIF